MQATSRMECAYLAMNRDNRRIVARLLALVLLTAPIGCASSKETPPAEMTGVTRSLADAPIWLTQGCRFHWKNEQTRRNVVCGVGSAAPNRNRIAARETAIARARSAIARSIEVTIESLVRVEDSGTGDGRIRAFVHQLTSESLPGCQLESVWQSKSGEIHALVSLQVAKLQQSVRKTRGSSLAAREDLAHRAADAFAATDSGFGSRPDETGSAKGGTE